MSKATKTLGPFEPRISFFMQIQKSLRITQKSPEYPDTTSLTVLDND